MTRHLIAIDQGTTGTTVVVMNEQMEILAAHNEESPQHYPKPGWVEHDPEEIWASVEAPLAGALAKAGISGEDVAAIGITNQRETTVLWDRETGRPVHNAIVWQCRRTADYCDGLKAAGLARQGILDPDNADRANEAKAAAQKPLNPSPDNSVDGAGQPVSPV